MPVVVIVSVNLPDRHGISCIRAVELEPRRHSERLVFIREVIRTPEIFVRKLGLPRVAGSVPIRSLMEKYQLSVDVF